MPDHSFELTYHKTNPRIAHYPARDGYRFAVRVWDVPEPVGRIVCLHGIISHGGWYLDSCAHLARAGFEVHFLDRRGSGINSSARGDVDNHQTWLNDVEDYLASLPGDKPRLLIGISWGGKLATAVARDRSDLVDALGLQCPGLFARKRANALQRVALQGARISPLCKKMVTVPLQNPALFTDEESWQVYIRWDPLVLRQVTARLGLADLQLSRYAAASANYIRCPVLLMLAGQDRIIDNRRVRAFIDSVPHVERRVIEYQDATHTLEFDAAAPSFYRDLTTWARAVVDQN